MLDEHLPPIGVIDSHTGGEPTRVVISGGPDLGSGPLPGRVALFRERFDDFRSTVACEPRGSDAAVGALLVPPTDPSCVCGVIFFNNVGYLGMCVHGTIGLAVTLGHLGRIGPGEHRIETPVGVVVATLIDSNHARVRNVVSFRTRRSVAVNVAGYGEVVGDVAWGGNWFFLVDRTPERLTLDNVERLTDITWRIRQALVAQGITGADGAEIDHIELFGAPGDLPADSRNFVLCPGKAYDRSPCGTGTSAKLACLAGDGKLQPGQVWRQASIVGSIFEGFVTAEQRATAEQQDAAGQFAIGEQQVFVPHITGSAYITAESTLLRHPADPFRGGIRA